MSNYRSKKINKKQRRCESIIKSDYNIESSETPTCYLGILNAGLCTGLREEDIVLHAVPHGVITRLLMIPNKSYCFLECAAVCDAERILKAMNGVAEIGQNGAIAYLSYFKALPGITNTNWSEDMPPGLHIVQDFVSETEEEELLKVVCVEENELNSSESLKHRRVRHFGYEFIYGINNVDNDRPLEEPIPNMCDVLWPRFQVVTQKLGILGCWNVPDQLTVNEYEPGQGIPQHVDTHSAFLDPILSLSLLGDVVMDFRKCDVRVSVLLPRRSLLIMSGESRYNWTHGITPRFLDVVPAKSGALTTKQRSKRVSLTFRHLRRGPCDCSWPMLCDTYKKGCSETDCVPEEIAVHLEEVNVHRVYDNIATHFSETRHTPWPKVASFLREFMPGSVIVDVGCGNGKYLNCNPNILMIGCDRSNGLLNVCSSNKKCVFRCECLRVPVRSGSIDGCISIAVIHHLSTQDRRLAAIREISRLLRKGGRALVYVWSKNQRSNVKKSSYLLQNKAVNKHKTTEEQQRQATEKMLKMHLDKTPVKLPIHTNRTDFLQRDILVPWKLKSTPANTTSVNAETNTTFLRYYHVFEEHELEELVAQKSTSGKGKESRKRNVGCAGIVMSNEGHTPKEEERPSTGYLVSACNLNLAPATELNRFSVVVGT